MYFTLRTNKKEEENYICSWRSLLYPSPLPWKRQKSERTKFSCFGVDDEIKIFLSHRRAAIVDVPFKKFRTLLKSFCKFVSDILIFANEKYYAVDQTKRRTCLSALRIWNWPRIYVPYEDFKAFSASHRGVENKVKF